MFKRVLDPKGLGMAWQTALRLFAPEKNGLSARFFFV